MIYWKNVAKVPSKVMFNTVTGSICGQIVKNTHTKKSMELLPETYVLHRYHALTFRLSIVLHIQSLLSMMIPR